MTQTALEIIILAAGKGSRMHSTLPKVLHCIAGKPLLQHVLDAVAPLKPAQVHVVVGHHKQQVMDYFANHDINWVIQQQQCGTGHAVQQALPSIKAGSHVLMMTADVPLVHSETLSRLVDLLRGFALGILTAKVRKPFGLGRIVREQDNICAIVEEKDSSAAEKQIKEINSGILCARADELDKWLSEIKNNNANNEFYLTDIVNIAYQQGNPIGSTHPQNVHEILGINSRLELARVERAYQQQQAELLMRSGVTIIDPMRIDIRGEVEIAEDVTIDVNCVIEGPCKIASGVQIAPNCVIRRCHIGADSIIHPNSVVEDAVIAERVSVGPFARIRPGTELADDVRIGNFVETKNAHLGSGTKVNHLSYVGDSRIGQRSNIGAGVITCNYDGANKHQTTIGDDVFVGSNSVLVAPLELEEGAFIGAGSTITKKVGKNQLAISRATQKQISGWQRPQKPADKK